MSKTLTIDVYDITEERADEAVNLLRRIKRDCEAMIACGGRQDGIDLNAVTDALTLCSAASLALAEPAGAADGARRPEDRPAPQAASALIDVAGENAEACGDCRVPRCRFCDRPGKRVAGVKHADGRVIEHYYLCETAGCIAAIAKTPQPLRLFAGGAS